MSSPFTPLRDNCLSRLLFSFLITIVVVVLFGCVILVGVFLPVSDELRIFVFLFGFTGAILLAVAGVVAWSVWQARQRASVMDEAFGPYGLAGERYGLAGRQYEGVYRGREINVYFYISGGRYTRVPVLQLYVTGRIPTRIGIGRRNSLSQVMGNLLHREPLVLAEPAFAEIELYPDDHDWAVGLFADPVVREHVANLLGEGLPGRLKALSIGPGSISLTLRYFNPASLTADSLRGILEQMIALAQLAEGQPRPSVVTEETDLLRRSREDRASFTWVVWAVVIVVLVCPVVFAAAVLAALMMTGP